MDNFDIRSRPSGLAPLRIMSFSGADETFSEPKKGYRDDSRFTRKGGAGHGGVARFGGGHLPQAGGLRREGGHQLLRQSAKGAARPRTNPPGRRRRRGLPGGRARRNRCRRIGRADGQEVRPDRHPRRQRYGTAAVYPPGRLDLEALPRSTGVFRQKSGAPGESRAAVDEGAARVGSSTSARKCSSAACRSFPITSRPRGRSWA